VIDCCGSEFNDGRDFSTTMNALFNGLLPLFENNTYLESLQLTFRTIHFASVESLHHAIRAYKALKSIKLSNGCNHFEKDKNLEKVLSR
jgi:hypothetical protein